MFWSHINLCFDIFAVYKHHLTWKASSLEYLSCQDSYVTGAIHVRLTDGSSLPIRKMPEMEVLGTMLATDASSKRSVEHRLMKGEKCFWAHAKVFMGPGSVKTKLRSWVRGPSTSSTFGSASWHLSKNLLIALKKLIYSISKK